MLLPSMMSVFAIDRKQEGGAESSGLHMIGLDFKENYIFERIIYTHTDCCKRGNGWIWMCAFEPVLDGMIRIVTNKIHG